MISYDDIADARVRLEGILVPTPVEASRSLSDLAGRKILLKPEHRQRTGSFKLRGAYNKISRLEPGGEVVAASAGNHAQGVARAARLTGHHATIFMPVSAAIPKVEATRADGATIRMEGIVVDDSIALAGAYAETTGATIVHPFDDPLIIAGQGTVGAEIADECEDDDAVVVVPIGGGGLISGIAMALKAKRPGMRVVGVEAAGAAGMRASLDQGKVVRLDHVETIADGIAVRSPSERTLEHVRALVDDVVTVTDEDISRALILLLERAKSVVEPAGAVGFAATLAGKIPGDGPVCAVLSGGNVDPIVLIKLIEFGLTAAGRYLILQVIVGDRPGELAALTDAVARMGLNVLHVEHHRVGLKLGVDRVEVILTLESRNAEHRDEAVRALRASGFDVNRIE
ncbi:MAG: threonine ammonia-lyase [Actinomycetota bacterium]